jgi:hypothetical protein
MTHATLRKNGRRKPRKMQPALEPGPRNASIQFILGYSKALKVVDAPPIGHIDLILN